jgi:hypothetical protein
LGDDARCITQKDVRVKRILTKSPATAEEDHDQNGYLAKPPIKQAIRKTPRTLNEARP